MLFEILAEVSMLCYFLTFRLRRITSIFLKGVIYMLLNTMLRPETVDRPMFVADQ
jgi:hypothetical protein